MDQSKQILPLLPRVYALQLEHMDWQSMEEIRLVCGHPLRVCSLCRECFLFPAVRGSDIETVVQRACQFSAYAYEETISQGYITVCGGHRIGVCGFGVPRAGGSFTLRELSSLNIRIAREIPGCAEKLLPHITSSTLILGPPGSGKTTLLRDLVRLLSDTMEQRIALADERGEVSASFSGKAQLQVGKRTDVLVNVAKSRAIPILQRTMNPQWIALDEITAPEDVAAMEQAVYCGTKLLATAHAECMDDLLRRPLYRRLIRHDFFRNFVSLRQDKTYEIREAAV